MTAQLSPPMQALKDRKLINHFEGKYSFLSNFYICFGPKTLEHHYQAAKAKYKKDARLIMAALTPGQAKRIGRKVKLVEGWENTKVDVMKELLKKKFAQPELRERLLATGDAWLVEGNTWHDNEFGACSCTQCRRLPRKNLLGKMLMSLRDEIRHQLTVEGESREGEVS